MARRLLPDVRTPAGRLQLALYTGTLAIVGLFALAAVLPLASNPVFCGKACHSMNPEYQTWQRSSHARVTCYACHVSPSYPDLANDKFVLGMLGIIQTVRNSYEKPINAKSEYGLHLPKVRCLRCHSPQFRRFTPRPGFNVTSRMHLKHLNAGLQCATCHNRVVHRGAERYEPLKSEWTESKNFKYPDFMKMREGCWRCHSKNPRFRRQETLKLVGNLKPPTSCRACHNRGSKPPKPSSGEYNHQIVNGIEWRSGLRRHGIVALKDFDACEGCHPRDDAEARRYNSKLPNCTTTCHGGVTMPHNIPKWSRYYSTDRRTPQWRRVHFATADRVAKATCAMCHDPEKTGRNFCQSCHHQGFARVNPNTAAPWKEVHFKVVKAAGAQQCFKCHLTEFCTTCHTTGNKPAPGVAFNRRT